jgi:hypothetical protein
MIQGTVPNPFSHDFIKGGPGSGNFGHAGRPGMRGGSSEGGSISRYEQAVAASKPIGNLTNDEVLAYERDAVLVLSHYPHSLEEANLLAKMTIDGNLKIPDVKNLLRRMASEGKIKRTVRLGGRVAYEATDYKDPYLSSHEESEMRDRYRRRTFNER